MSAAVGSWAASEAVASVALTIHIARHSVVYQKKLQGHFNWFSLSTAVLFNSLEKPGTM